MNPFYFGSSDKQLFGIHHPPEGAEEVYDGAVLICPPFGPEYVASHRVLQQLAMHLARSGLHVLRFDYYGTGDSAGEAEDVTLEQWIEDVNTAAEELRDTSGSNRLCLLGLRLGASLAAVAGAEAMAEGDMDVFATVLWEPVLRGDEYCTEMLGEQDEWVRGTFPKPTKAALAGPPEVLGFPFGEAFQRDLARIDLPALSDPPADYALVIQNVQGPDHKALATHLADVAEDAQYHYIEQIPCWKGPRGGPIALVPVEVNKRIAGWIAEAYG